MACSFLTMVRPHYPHIIMHTSVLKCVSYLCLSFNLSAASHTSALLSDLLFFPGARRWRVFCGLWMCFHFVLCLRSLSVHPLFVLDCDIGSLWTEAEVQILISTAFPNMNTYKRGYCVAYSSRPFQIFT